MIRAYFFAKKSGAGPDSWRRYVDQLIDPNELAAKTDAGRIQLRGLLSQRFSMEYLSFDDLRAGVKVDEVNALASQRQAARQEKHPELSANDALIAFAVYAQRKAKAETANYDGFGLRTWWLTKETMILSLTGQLVVKEGGAYIMRPEFLLNFVSLSPKAADVRERFAALLPTTAGLQLGRYMDQKVMHQMLDDVVTWNELSPERVTMKLSTQVNRLKHDRFKQYLQPIS